MKTMLVILVLLIILAVAADRDLGQATKVVKHWDRCLNCNWILFSDTCGDCGAKN